MKTVIVTGVTGFIGTQLIQSLLHQHYTVIGYSRKKQLSNNSQLHWIQSFSALENLLSSQNVTVDYVVNLAGESIGQGRWTATRKQKLIASRVDTTRKLYQCLDQLQIQPECIVSGSAVGFYGIDSSEQWNLNCDESCTSQHIFMSELCQRWENAALSYSHQNTKIMRLAVVFGKGGGILPQMLLPIKLNLIRKIGTGQQPMTWVHMNDVIQAILFLFKNTSQQKIFNIVAPDHISQVQFAKISSQVLKRKPMLFLPSFVMKLLMGEQSQLVLNGQYVQPTALLKQGFQFQYPDLEIALRKIIEH